MKYFIKIFVLVLLVLPLGVTAATNLTFHDLPGLETETTQGYIEALYILSISLAAIAVVLKIMYAGVLYMTTDLIGSKEKAKNEIKSALLGLLIILGAVTILNTINPKLLELNFLKNAGAISGPQQNTTKESPEQQCPDGLVLMGCEDSVSFDTQCRQPTETSWCAGTISYPNTSPQPTGTGSWVRVARPSSDGDSAAMVASNMERECKAEGGRPSSAFAGESAVRVTCAK